MKPLVAFAALLLVACLCLPTADAGNRRLQGVHILAPVAVQPVWIQPQPIVIQPQPIVIQPRPVAVVPVVPVRKEYATPLRDLLFGRYRYLPVCPQPPSLPDVPPSQPLPEDGPSIQPIEG